MTNYETNRQRSDRLKRSENEAAHEARMESFRKSEEAARLRRQAAAEAAESKQTEQQQTPTPGSESQ